MPPPYYSPFQQPNQNHFMLEQMSSFQSRMMEQQQAHMESLEQRFQQTIEKTVEAIATSLASSHRSSNAEHAPTPPPEEILYSSVSTKTVTK